MGKSVILSASICIIFCSCALNKSVDLIPQEPFEYFENNIHFRINGNQNLWITFQAPHVKQQEFITRIPFFLNIRTNEEIEDVYLKSINLCIKELDVEIINNIMLPIENIRNKLSNPEYNFHGYIDPNYTELFRTEDIKNNYPIETTFEELYRKFKNVREAEFHTIII